MIFSMAWVPEVPSYFTQHSPWLAYQKQWFIVIYYFTISFSFISLRAYALQSHV